LDRFMKPESSSKERVSWTPLSTFPLPITKRGAINIVASKSLAKAIYAAINSIRVQTFMTLRLDLYAFAQPMGLKFSAKSRRP
jgi:hypothetical protein